MRTLRKYLSWLWRHSEGVRWRIAAGVVLGLVNVALTLCFIWVCKRLVDIATGEAGGSIMAYTGIVLGIIVARLAVQALSVRIENLSVSKMNFIIRSRLYNILLEARWSGREKLHSGDTLNRIETDSSTVTGVICTDFQQFVTTMVQLVAAVVFLCLMDWRLALLLVVVTPLLLSFSKIFFKKMRTLTRNIRDTESRVQSHLQESLQHRVVIKSMENEPAMAERLDDLQSIEYGQVLERTRFNIFARTVVSAAFQLGYIAAFLWGVYGIWHGSITFGVMTAFLQLVGQIQRPVVNLTRQIPSFVYATASIDRLMELEDAPKEEMAEPRLLNGSIGVKVDSVTFRYPDGERDILKDFSYDFAPGSRTAIVGETGIGKSTLVRMMLALLHPVKGSISLYNSDDSVEVSPSTRCNLVYVPQGNTLFSGTIRENLRMGDPSADDARMAEVLETAAASFVMDLPDGLDTVCGEGGAGLSEGQAQRIAIARGLLRGGNVLLLDEFSSSLDPETEARLMENLVSSSPGKTMIFITHREKIAEYCHGVCRLERA